MGGDLVTDARLRGPWLNAMLYSDLSDAAWRVFTGALMWCAEQETDGVIPRRYLHKLHPEGEQHDAWRELEAAGIWAAGADGGRVLNGWADELGQNTAEKIAQYRENSRRRQQEYRDRQKGDVTGDETRDVTHNVTHRVGIGINKKRGTSESPTPLPPRKSDLCPQHEWNRRDQCTEPHDNSGDRPDTLVSLSGVPHAS